MIIPDQSPGCSFVLVANDLGTVRDYRLYVRKSFRNQGYGFLATTFVKAYLFPWFSDHHAPPWGFFLPLGGARGAQRITLVPGDKSKSFYLKNGWVLDRLNPTYVFNCSGLVK